ncbi:prepilin signal peptidase PulO-like enzyme (type II secretory pathway) [Rhodobium orientis]|uniref:Holin-X, holin superfamily III n=1 Tax=Rhodobium orientis TaxID=34017 RepID=A0A327JWB9_9HYPH|nr:hypothetical protein [Rhodobium orientis]MBB4302722.1 prepilin signal peptidase PulO-like enzyme (type II secretory pathway) [Rhodobium orientis]MBK5948504.1 hypothetical protein [Rhodobium orientis]RAI29773.1 hypothetical protein CH339_01790 [Rhodobium orientis]
MYRLIGTAASLASQDVGSMVDRAKRSAIVYAIAAVLLLTAYAFVMVVVYQLLADAVGSGLDAALLIAGATALVAILALIVMALVNRRQKRMAARRNAARRMQLLALASVAPSLMRSKPLLITAALGALAYFALNNSDDGDD